MDSNGKLGKSKKYEKNLNPLPDFLAMATAP
jgi:hypothetical protein